MSQFYRVDGHDFYGNESLHFYGDISLCTGPLLVSTESTFFLPGKDVLDEKSIAIKANMIKNITAKMINTNFDLRIRS